MWEGAVLRSMVTLLTPPRFAQWANYFPTWWRPAQMSTTVGQHLKVWLRAPTHQVRVQQVRRAGSVPLPIITLKTPMWVLVKLVSRLQSQDQMQFHFHVQLWWRLDFKLSHHQLVGLPQ